MEKSRFLSFGTSQQILFCKRLALYLRSGIPISQALFFISEDSRSTSATYILKEVEKTIETGLPLSQGLQKFPRQFSSFVIGFIGTGEASGALAETLDRLAIMLSKRSALRKKIMSALAYPLVILLGTIAVALFLTLFIFPKIIPVLKGFHTTLPLSTRILIGINSLFTHDWIVLLLGLVILMGILLASLKQPRVRLVLEKAFLRIPIFSLLYKNYAIATFTRTIALQLRGGVRIISALALVRSALPGSVYSTAIESIEKSIAEGQRFSLALRVESKLFPPLVCQMVAAGEATGTLSANLESLADMYEEALDELSKNLTVLIEPVLMVCMGLVVGFVALAIITPIYQVTQNLNIQ